MYNARISLQTGVGLAPEWRIREARPADRVGTHRRNEAGKPDDEGGCEQRAARVRRDGAEIGQAHDVTEGVCEERAVDQAGAEVEVRRVGAEERGVRELRHTGGGVTPWRAVYAPTTPDDNTRARLPPHPSPETAKPSPDPPRSRPSPTCPIVPRIQSCRHDNNESRACTAMARRLAPFVSNLWWTCAAPKMAADVKTFAASEKDAEERSGQLRT